MSAVSSGVDGLLLKNAAPDTLIDCLRNVAAGGAWLPTTTVGAAIDREADRGKRAHQILDPLTVRERQIVRFACLAMPNKSIAKELKIAEGTVKIHLNNAYMKLDVKSRAELRKKLNLILDLEFDN
ncbi:MAG: response regulator transcription factor [Hoeflea sp.]|nr:response regulator transcription factor [Hoeflea sp.]